jgi:hypothetical protein
LLPNGIDLAQGDDGIALAWDLKALGIPVLFIGGQPARTTEPAVAIASMAKPYSGAATLEAVGYLLATLVSARKHDERASDCLAARRLAARCRRLWRDWWATRCIRQPSSRAQST